MTSSSEDFTSSTESGSTTTAPSTFGGRYLAGADSDGGSRRHRSRSRSKSRRSTSTRKAHSRSSKKPSSSKSRRSGHSSKSRRSGHSSKSRSRKPSSGGSRSRKASSSRSHKSRRHSSKSGSRKSRRSHSRSRSQSKSRSARRNQSEWHKTTTPQQKSLSCCASFGIVVQAAVLLLAFFYTIFSYYNAHSSILYVLTVYTGVQGAMWIVFMLSNCVAALHGACIQFMVVCFVGLVELGLFMYFMISDSRPACDRFGCTFMHGAFEHRFGAVALFVIGFLVHAVYAIVFICEAVSQWKQWEEYDAEQKAAKERIVIAHVSRRRSRKSRRSSSKTETKTDKPKKSRSSTKSKSVKKPTKSKSRRSKRSTRSQATVATVSSVPSTTSMVSYVPQQKPVSTQPLAQLPSHSSVQSGYGHHCPVDALQCNVPNCPYYRQNQELVRQLSSCHQNLSNSASFRQPQQQALQPTVRQEIGPDQSRSIVIDLPQTQSQSQTVANYNNNLGGGYGDNTVDIQRVVVKIPPPGHQQLQPQQSGIRDADGNAYLTTITPVQKALR